MATPSLAPTQIFVFYSWQSDQPPGRNLVERALQDAVARLRTDGSLAVEPVVDRDTAGTPGSPSISGTIFEKIDRAGVLVADVTFINEQRGGRPCPNPNVLVELGYAASALGWDRIILVLNSQFGGPEELPFDLRHRRAMPFSAVPGQDNSAERNRLSSDLEQAIRLVLPRIPEPVLTTPQVRALSAIEARAPGRRRDIRAFAENVSARLAGASPDIASGDWRDAQFLAALSAIHPVVLEFAEVARAAAVHDDRESSLLLFEVIRQAAHGLVIAPGRSGTIWEHEHDYWRYVVLVLHLVLVGALVAEERFGIAGDVVREPLPLIVNGRSVDLPYGERSHSIQRLARWDDTKSASPIGRFLNHEFSAGDGAIGFPEIADADLFILLSAGVTEGFDGQEETEWTGWTWPHTTRIPRFLSTATSARNARALADAIGVPFENLQAHVSRTLAAAPRVFGWRAARFGHPMQSWDAGLIATRP